LWEKDLEDFLKPMNHSLIKGKLLCESQEITSIKYVDVHPKAQIVRLTENINNGRFKIELAVVNHESKHDIDFFDIELMTV
jgi:tmRNA-binding protein